MAPSTELRHWYGHDPARYTEFARRYRAELDQPELAEPQDELRALAVDGTVTLLTATKNVEQSHLGVLKTALEER